MNELAEKINAMQATWEAIRLTEKTRAADAKRADRPRVYQALTPVLGYAMFMVEYSGRTVPFPTWASAMDWANQLALAQASSRENGHQPRAYARRRR